jgi:hypothetical protein
MKSTLALTAGAITIAALASGCTSTVALSPATYDAVNPLCASVVVRLPDTVTELPKRETNAQGTGAWGSPESVLLRCGVEPPQPTASLPCVLIGEVYWLRDAADAPNYVFTTYGREPATEVIVDADVTAPGAVLYDLESAVATTTSVGGCTEIEDSLEPSVPLPTQTATPAPTPAPAE